MKPHICIFFPSVESGGLESAIFRIAGFLVENGFEITLFYRHCNDEVSEKINIRIKKHKARSYLNIPFIPHKFKAALEIIPAFFLFLRVNRPDCILSVQSTTLCIPIAKIMGVPVIHRESSNSLEALSAQKNVFLRNLVLFGKFLTYRFCARLITNSQGSKASLCEIANLPAARVTVIYNPVDPSELAFLSSAKADKELFDPKYPLLIYVGRLSWEKGVETLIMAFKEILQQRDARLLILGEGSERSRLSELIKNLGVTEYIKMPGYVRNPYVYMSKSQIFLLGSSFEGLPNSLLEAVALKIPAISTDCPTGPREILLQGEGGRLVPVGDWRAIANAILEILSDPGSASVRAEKAYAALSRFHPGAIGGQYASLFSEVISGHRQA